MFFGVALSIIRMFAYSCHRPGGYADILRERPFQREIGSIGAQLLEAFKGGVRADAGLAPANRVEPGDLDPAAVQVRLGAQFRRLADDDVKIIVLVFIRAYRFLSNQWGLRSPGPGMVSRSSKNGL
jgi:hypothetical protein